MRPRAGSIHVLVEAGMPNTELGHPDRVRRGECETPARRHQRRSPMQWLRDDWAKTAGPVTVVRLLRKHPRLLPAPYFPSMTPKSPSEVLELTVGARLRPVLPDRPARAARKRRGARSASRDRDQGCGDR